jgi:hypothetical protein
MMTTNMATNTITIVVELVVAQNAPTKIKTISSLPCLLSFSELVNLVFAAFLGGIEAALLVLSVSLQT